MAAPYEGMYAKLKFPNYVFREYPKIIRHPHTREEAQVESKSHELAQIAEWGGKASDDIVADVAHERNELAQRNAELEARHQSTVMEIAELKAQLAKMAEHMLAPKTTTPAATAQSANPSPALKATELKTAVPSPRPLPSGTPPRAG